MTVLELRDELNELMQNNADAIRAPVYAIDRDSVDGDGVTHSLSNSMAVVGTVELFGTEDSCPEDWDEEDSDQIAVLRLE